MALTALAPRDRRALSWLGVALAGAIAIRVLPSLLLGVQELRDRAQFTADRRHHAERLLAEEVRMADSLRARRLRLDAARTGLLRPRGAVSVAADLGALVRETATGSGLAVLSASVSADTATVGPLQRASLQLEAEGDVSGLAQFLLALELAPGFLRVMDLTVTQPDPGGTVPGPERLRVRVAIDGVALRAAIAGSEGSR